MKYGTTSHTLPSALLDEGFVVPTFDYDKLTDISKQPVGSGSQAEIYSARTPSARYVGMLAIKVVRRNTAARRARPHDCGIDSQWHARTRGATRHSRRTRRAVIPSSITQVLRPELA